MNIQSNLTKKQKLLVNVAHIREDGLTISGELSPGVFDIGDGDRFRCTSPLNYELHLALVSKGILVTGIVNTKFSCKCDRCLTSYLHQLGSDDICHYVRIPNDNQLDLTEEIREDVLIGIPQIFLCSPNCVGLCSDCGQNLNIQNCSCRRSKGASLSIWSSLDNLRI